MAAYYSTLFLFLFFNFFLSGSLSLEPPFPCNENSNNTLCNLYTSKNTETCTDYRKNLLTLSEENEILNFHTNLRENLIEGKGNLPKALFMRKLFWDENLAKMAQKWADKCTTEKDPNTNLENEPIGQNIITVNGEAGKNISSLINVWADGIKYLTPEVIVKYQKPKSGQFNYESTTQVIWWNTTLIGCGRSSFNFTKCTGSKNITKKCFKNKVIKLVCNYFPAGNREGDPVYIRLQDNNLICQYDDKHVLCKNMTSEKEEKHRDLYLDDNSVEGRIKNRMNGIWPTAGKGTSISSNLFLVLFFLLKFFILQLDMISFNAIFNKNKS